MVKIKRNNRINKDFKRNKELRDYLKKRKKWLESSYQSKKLS